MKLFSPDGKHVAARDLFDEGRILLIDKKTGNIMGRGEPPPEPEPPEPEPVNENQLSLFN